MLSDYFYFIDCIDMLTMLWWPHAYINADRFDIWIYSEVLTPNNHSIYRSNQ